MKKAFFLGGNFTDPFPTWLEPGEDGPFGAEKSITRVWPAFPDENKQPEFSKAGWKKPTDESRDLGGGNSFF